ncbi:hypothetical protein [Actinomadura soli]|uniref:hypothetical protein n=1 Tax=Actinomadura soli TaxID=2508997 RepID=UPI0014864B2D|nr:hypothetical protein [Actinomadura soli]
MTSTTRHRPPISDGGPSSRTQVVNGWQHRHHGRRRWCRTIIWRDLGADPDDPSTWPCPIAARSDHTDAPFVAAANTPRQAAFRRKNDPELARVAVAPFLKAAEGALPRWVRAQTHVRNTTVFAGSAIALLAVTLG